LGYGRCAASNRGFLSITSVWVTNQSETLDVANLHEDLAWLFFAEILVVHVGSLCANLTCSWIRGHSVKLKEALLISEKQCLVTYLIQDGGTMLKFDL